MTLERLEDGRVMPFMNPAVRALMDQILDVVIAASQKEQVTPDVRATWLEIVSGLASAAATFVAIYSKTPPHGAEQFLRHYRSFLAFESAAKDEPAPGVH